MAFNPQQAAQIIRQEPTYKALADDGSPEALEDLLDLLNDKNRQHTDATLYTSRFLIKRFGTDLSRIMLAGFKAAADADPLMGQMWLVLANGLNFSDADVQANIDILAGLGVWQAAADAIAGEGNFPNADATIAAQLKAVGIWYESHAEDLFGRGTVLVAQDILDAIAVYQVDILAIQVTERYNEVRLAIEQGTVTTWAEARQALGAE